jgi:hypothetical protein
MMGLAPMHIDRSRFLFLTASLAAAACDRTQSTGSPETGGADPAISGPSEQADADSKPGGDPVWLEIEPGTEDKPQNAGNADCDNSVGRPPPCSISPPGSHCESFDHTLRTCQSFAEFMQPRAAEAAVNCVVAASGTWEVCDWTIVQTCAIAGLQATCVEPATRSECDSINSQCGGSLDVFTCQQALSAVKPHRIQQVASCVREFCEVTFCVSGDFGMF